MTAYAGEDPLVREMLTLVDALAGGTQELDAATALSTAEWRDWFELVEVHGLAPGLSRLLERPRWSGLSPELKARCHRQYVAQTARSLAAQRQFQEIHEVLRDAGIPVIPLKGLAFAGTLYPDPGRRQFGDLDVLVPETDGPRAFELLLGQGYTRVAAYTSAEEELLHEREAHFCPLVRPGALPLEVHTQILKERRSAHVARADVWASAKHDARGVLRLDPLHATVAAAAHYATHLRLGAGHLKWMVDLALLLNHPATGETAALQRTAQRWEVWEAILPLLAAAKEYVSEPRDAFTAQPVASSTLVYSPKHAAGLIAVSAWERLGRLRELPGIAARARYLGGLLFPNSDHLRYRYGIPPGHSVGAQRFTHPLRLAARFFTSVRYRRTQARWAPLLHPRTDDEG